MFLIVQFIFNTYHFGRTKVIETGSQTDVPFFNENNRHFQHDFAIGVTNWSFVIELWQIIVQV